MDAEKCGNAVRRFGIADHLYDSILIGPKRQRRPLRRFGFIDARVAGDRNPAADFWDRSRRARMAIRIDE